MRDIEEEKACVWNILSVPVVFFSIAVGLITWICYGRIQYFIKLIILNSSWQIFSVFPIVSALIWGRNPSNRRYFSRFVSLTNTLLVGTKYIVRGRQNLDFDGPCVIVSNHQSSIDGNFMVELGNYKGSIVILKKSLLFLSGLLGIAFYCCSAIFVDRKNPAQAKKSLNEALERIKHEKLKPQFYPEGTRHMGDEMLPFKKGAFVMAIQGQIPILPVVASSYRHFYDKKNYIFKKGTVIVTCLPPIQTEGKTMADIDDLISDVRSRMQSTIDSTTTEVEKNL